MARHADTAELALMDDEALEAASQDFSVPSQPESEHAGAEADADSDSVEGEEQRAIEASKPGSARSPLRTALSAGLMIVVILGGLTGWLGYRAHAAEEAAQQRQAFLQAGRQAAINLTTVDYAHVDADVARILDSATGTFYDDFRQRSQPFIDVVKKTQSTSVGTIAEAGLESVGGNEAQVLVAVQVKTSVGGAPAEEKKGWRMRINVQKTGGGVKVSNVAFVV
jgi:Mce-associated membrane protein